MADDHPIGHVMGQLAAHWPDAATPQMQLTMLLHRLQELMIENAQVVLGRYELSLSDYEVLSILRCEPAPHETTPGDLTDKMMMSSGGMTKLLKSMTDRGLIERMPSQTDRRVRPLRLTQRGRELVERALVDLRRDHQNIFDDLPEGMTKQMLADTLSHLTIAAELRRTARDNN